MRFRTAEAENAQVSEIVDRGDVDRRPSSAPPGHCGAIDRTGNVTADGANAGPADPVEAALAEAVRLAAQAGEWTVVAELGRELAERRRARQAPAISSLDARRAKRERGRK